MKRYKKIIALVVVVVFSIGIYYIQPLFGPNKKPEFSVVAKSGDKSLTENMSITGYYYENSQLGIGTEMKITPGKTIYQSEKSYLDQLKSFGNINEKISQLQEDYRGFMRGKNSDLANFYEDEMILAYAEITTDAFSTISKDSKITIDVLNKQTNEESSFSVNLPKADEYGYMYVEDVQVANNQLIVITNGYRVNSSNSQDEQHLYSISLPKEKIEKDEKIQLDLIDSKGKQIQYVELMNASTSITSANYLVYRVELNDDSTNMDMYEENQVMTLPVYELIGVNVETGEQFLINGSEELNRHGIAAILSTESNNLYFYKKDGANLSLYEYDLNQKELTEVKAGELSAAQQAMFNEGVIVQVREGVMYFVTSYKIGDNELQMLAFDSNSGELVFEGIIEEKTDYPAKREEVHIENILFEQ